MNISTNEPASLKPKLTLKKRITPATLDKPTKEVKHFKHVKLNPVGVRLIGFVQNYYEELWRKLDLMDGGHSEKKQCLKRLKESCNWMCRAIALYHEEKE